MEVNKEKEKELCVRQKYKKMERNIQARTKASLPPTYCETTK